MATPTRPRPSPTPEEEREWLAERAAILVYALRHLASAWHRKHATPDGPTWAHCSEHFCKMAHEASEGRLMAATKTEYGVVVSLKEKGA
jgi:hypothetical protein